MTVGHSFIGRLLPLGASLGAATLLVFTGANSLEIVRGGRDGARGGKPVAGYEESRPAGLQNDLDITRIPGWHLFGKHKPGAKAPAPKPQLIEAPATRLKLTLQGTFLGDKATEEGWAIISTPDKDQRLYRIGDEIPGGATLYAVEARRVILSRNGRHESLELPRPTLEEGAGPEKNRAYEMSSPGPGAAPGGSPAARREQRALIEEMKRIRQKFSRPPR